MIPENDIYAGLIGILILAIPFEVAWLLRDKLYSKKVKEEAFFEMEHVGEEEDFH
jgi:hypothetical protein